MVRVGEHFFGELSFDPDDLMRISEDGKGYLNIIRLTDIQDKPKLFSTFMLSLLAEIYATFPEEGDLSQPKLVIFIDEAHLIFNEASKALLQQIENKANEKWDKLDQEFYNYEDNLNELNIEFIKKNKKDV